jgi:hypothetical protein
MAIVCRPSPLRAFCIALLMVAATGAGSDAFAQRPSQAQINAMRQSCRSDYIKAIAPEAPPAAASTASPSQAAPVTPAPSMSTPSTSAPSMSAPSAPAAATPPTATAQPSAAGVGRPSQAQLRSVRQSCGADYRVHCAGIQPGGSASIACLKRNITTLSGQCKQALGAVAAGATTAAAPAVAPPPVEPAPLLVSPREELFILRMACGGDYAAFCRGLRPGAGRIAACLRYNSASLSPRCQQALTSLREGR